MSDDIAEILSLVMDEGNRRLLNNWIDDQSEYSPVELGDSIKETAFDICILDKGGFNEHINQLRHKKKERAPVLLPFLLLLPDSDTDLIRSDAGEVADNVLADTIDEVVTLPIKQEILQWRLSALKRLREQSLELKAREQRLRRFRNAATSSGHAFYMTDPDGTIEWVNPAFEEITGYGADEAVGKTPRILKSGEMPDSYYEELWETLLAGGTWEETIVNRRKDGDLYHAQQTIDPVLDENGDIEAFVAVQTDITERKRLAEDLEETIRQLRVIDRVLRHNLHNDMNVILGHAELIESQAEGNVVDNAEEIVSTGARLLDTIDKERQITKLLSLDKSPRPIDLGATIDAVVADARCRYPAAEITVNRPADITVHAIASLSRAFDELLTNAISHSDQQTPSIAIDIGRQDESVEVRIADDGPGIPEMEYKVLTDEAEIDALFHGSGLGLWLVYLVVQASAGSVRFEENERRGNVVTIELPAATQQVSQSTGDS